MSGSPWLLEDHELNTVANCVKAGAERGPGDDRSPEEDLGGLGADIDIMN
jgi:hypothetical protein